MFRHRANVEGIFRAAFSGIGSASSRVLMTLMILSCLGSQGAAAVLTWDGNSAAPLGGDGLWDLASLSWLNEGNAYQAWDNSGNDDAVFGTVGGNVDISSTAVNVHSISFDVSGYTLTGSNSVNLSGTSPSIAVAADVLATISAPVTGSSGLQKTGSGVLDLKGSNTYTGTTIVSDGVLRLSNANALPGGIGASGGLSNLNIAGGVVELTDTTMGFEPKSGHRCGSSPVHGLGWIRRLQQQSVLLNNDPWRLAQRRRYVDLGQRRICPQWFGIDVEFPSFKRWRQFSESPSTWAILSAPFALPTVHTLSTPILAARSAVPAV